MMNSLNNIKELLKHHGIQPSSSRIAVASFACSSKSHPTAEEIKREVEKNFPSISLATIYNTLNLFVEKGLLQEVHDPRMKSLRYDSNTTEHFHFIDEATGELSDLHPSMISMQLNHDKLDSHIQISKVQMTLRGHRKHKTLSENKET